jgi:hypothetical protein
MNKRACTVSAVYVLCVAGILCLLAARVLFGERNWGSSRIAESKRRGESIAKAVRAFKADHGDFPEALGDLLPRYMSSVPAPVAGSEKWVYRVYKDEGTFMLQFGVPSSVDPTFLYPSCKYGSRSGRWYTND